MTQTTGIQYTSRIIKIYWTYVVGTLIGAITYHIINYDFSNFYWWRGWLAIPVVSLIAILTQPPFAVTTLVSIADGENNWHVAAIVNILLPAINCCCCYYYFRAGNPRILVPIGIIAIIHVMYNAWMETKFVSA